VHQPGDSRLCTGLVYQAMPSKRQSHAQREKSHGDPSTTLNCSRTRISTHIGFWHTSKLALSSLAQLHSSCDNPSPEESSMLHKSTHTYITWVRNMCPMAAITPPVQPAHPCQSITCSPRVAICVCASPTPAAAQWLPNAHLLQEIFAALQNGRDCICAAGCASCYGNGCCFC
jgi:hypothetical protein